MSRTQKKCFIAATGSHLLLVVMLFVGPAFFTAKPKMEEINLLTFVPEMTTYEKAQGGGSPKGGTPPPPPQRQAEPPKPAAAQIEKPSQPQTKDQQVEKAEPTAAESSKTRKVQPNLRRVTRPTTSQRPTTEVANASANPTPSRALAAHENTIKTLRSGLSSSTSVDLPLGPGGGGATYANFYDAIGKVYYDAWIEPDVETSGELRVDAVVTIARSGEVISSRITKPSGNAAVDQSVQATLNRVRFAVPLPAGSNESQKVVPIGFTARIKKGTG